MKLSITNSLKGRAKALSKLFIPIFLLCCLLSAKTYATAVDVCMGTNPGVPSCASSFILANPGGSWSSSNPSVGTVDPSTGVFTPITPGTTTISYSGSGCGTFSYDIAVRALPSVTIDGLSSICLGSSISLTANDGGTGLPAGTWSSGNTGVATVGASTGVVTGIASGTATISYSVTNSYGCPYVATKVVTVNAVPTISGPCDVVSSGNTITLTTDIPGGAWVSSDPTKATMPSSGSSVVVTGVAVGTTLISYTSPAGCITTKLITVTAPFDFTVCEIAPQEVCNDTFVYCPGMKLRIDAPLTCSGLTATGIPTVNATGTWTPASGSTPAGWVFTFTSAPAAGYNTYTITATLGSYTVARVIKVFAASDPTQFCSMAVSSCKSCPAEVYTNLYTPDNILDATKISATTPGKYYIPKTAITAQENFRLRVSPAPGSEFFVDQNVNLVVKDGDNIVLDNCHFFRKETGITTAGSIRVESATATMTKLRVINNTLIENFNRGIQVAPFNPTSAPSAGSYILEVDGAIFNHNTYDIGIGDIVEPKTTATRAYRIVNSVFTNRTLCSYKQEGSDDCGANAYPHKWPTVDYLKTVTVPGSMSPGYGVDAFTKSSASSGGIYLAAVGRTTGVGDTAVHDSITVGDPTDSANYNLFDNKKPHGIYVQASNANIVNNVFRESTSGIETSVQGITTPDFYYLTQLDKGVSGTHNRFYNCGTAVYCFSCYHMRGRYAEMSTTYAGTSNTTNGYYLNGGKTGFNFSFTDNTTRNVGAGVNSNPLGDGSMLIKNNIFTGKVSPTDAGSGRFGIWAAGLPSLLPPLSVGQIKIEGNTVSGFDEYGIYGSAGKKEIIISNNTVALTTAATAANGIYVTGGMFTIDHNEVSSNDATLTSGFGVRILATNYNGVVSCNYVHDLKYGFYFDDSNATSGITWKNNVMLRDQYGMYLKSGSIGVQGDDCHPSDNFWAETSTWHWDGGTGTGGYHTYSSVYPVPSKLYVRGVAGYQPSNNTGGSAAVTYTTPGSWTTTSGTCDPIPANCSPYVAPPAGRATNSIGEDSHTADIAKMKTTAMDFSIFPNPAEDNISIQSSASSDATVQVTIRNYAAQVVYSGRQKLKNGLANIKLPNAASGMYMVTVTDDKGQSQQFKLAIQGNSNRAGN